MLEVFGSCGMIESLHFGGKTDWGILYEVLACEGHTIESIGALMQHYEQALERAMTTILDQYEIWALPGALESITTLRQHPDTLLGIITGNVALTAMLKLKAIGFDPTWFPIGAYGSESIHRNDLPPLALQRAMLHLGRDLLPAQMTIIGDTPADIACAQAVGARSVAVCTGFASREDLIAMQPDLLLDDLTELVDALENL
ncbi:MAG: HAD hydrolase-like protein, partial [Anaerolineae bacterium]|nr:HAD hydrolase-like protein [Anaerolineae bacterium]